MGIGAILGAAVGVGGSLLGASATKKAAAQQAALEQKNLDLQRYMYDTNRSDQAPYREAGYGSLKQLVAGTQPGAEYNRQFTLADFAADPGYGFVRSEGQRGIEGSAAARGGLFSGASLKALNAYNSGLASQEYGKVYDRWQADKTDRFNRLASIANIGQTSVARTGQAGSDYASGASQAYGRMGEAIAQGGNARASGYVGAANALSNAINQYSYGQGAGSGGGAYPWQVGSVVIPSQTPPYYPGY